MNSLIAQLSKDEEFCFDACGSENFRRLITSAITRSKLSKPKGKSGDMKFIITVKHDPQRRTVREFKKLLMTFLRDREITFSIRVEGNDP